MATLKSKKNTKQYIFTVLDCRMFMCYTIHIPNKEQSKYDYS